MCWLSIIVECVICALSRLRAQHWPSLGLGSERYEKWYSTCRTLFCSSLYDPRTVQWNNYVRYVRMCLSMCIYMVFSCSHSSIIRPFCAVVLHSILNSFFLLVDCMRAAAAASKTKEYSSTHAAFWFPLYVSSSCCASFMLWTFRTFSQTCAEMNAMQTKSVQIVRMAGQKKNMNKI